MALITSDMEIVLQMLVLPRSASLTAPGSSHYLLRPPCTPASPAAPSPRAFTYNVLPISHLLHLFFCLVNSYLSFRSLLRDLFLRDLDTHQPA